MSRLVAVNSTRAMPTMWHFARPPDNAIARPNRHDALRGVHGETQPDLAACTDPGRDHRPARGGGVRARYRAVRGQGLRCAADRLPDHDAAGPGDLVGRGQAQEPEAAEPPYVAFALVMLASWSTRPATASTSTTPSSWWDDLNHFVNWVFLNAGIGLLIVGAVRPTWARIVLVAGIGSLLALGWEIGEWYTFIRHGTEIETAYEDTLGDMTLGTLGGTLAALIVARSKRPEGSLPPVSSGPVRRGRDAGLPPVLDVPRRHAGRDLHQLGVRRSSTPTPTSRCGPPTRTRVGTTGVDAVTFVWLGQALLMTVAVWSGGTTTDLLERIRIGGRRDRPLPAGGLDRLVPRRGPGPRAVPPAHPRARADAVGLALFDLTLPP